MNDWRIWDLSVIYLIVKPSPSSKLKPNVFLDGVNSISYVIIVISRNGVDVGSSSHVIKLRMSEL